jgi:hypothetical protein
MVEKASMRLSSRSNRARHQHGVGVEAADRVARERSGAEGDVEHLHHAEQAGFGQHPRQRAGDRRRRFGVSERQPALQRNQAHLHREADEQAGDDRGAGERRDHGGLVGDRGELERTDLGMRQQDAEVHQIGARRAHQEVDEAGAQGLGSLFVDDQEVRGPGHQFPEDVEVAELVRRRHADQRAGHQEGEEVVAIGGRGAADVAD